MRISEAQKTEVRERVLAQARLLFARRDPARVSTREVASAARIAHGTLFNYFPTQEALVLTLLGADLQRAHARFRARRRAGAALEEELFALVAAELEELAGARALALAALSALGPLADAGGVAAELRARELALVAELCATHSSAAPPAHALHLYWSLFLGVLSFWARDASPNGEDTLALLDETTRLVAQLGRGTPRPTGAQV
ncbi:MAG: TetR/AcrR family transcriptional regulator [Planctomycetes bacterium]|nr:TetR/AcrR family transcriptional regulator [Planctomycetota bacterium]